MKRRLAMLSLSLAISAMGLTASSSTAVASELLGPFCDCGYMLPAYRARWYNWNRNYSYTDDGQPTALVVPPTANLQTNWGWGVASSRISRIDHQFQRNFPGNVCPGQSCGGPFRPTPVWPSDTTQFGVYYVRGPW